MRTPDPALQGRRREQILEAAAVCFVRHGFHQTSMQEICAAAQMSPGAVYRYFVSKDAIIEAIADAHRAESAAFLQKLEDSGDFVTGFINAATRSLQLSIEKEYPRLGVEILAEASRNPKVAKLFEKADVETKKTLVRLLQGAMKRGDIDSTIKAEPMAEILLALIEGIEGRSILNPSPKLRALAPTFALLISRFLKPAQKNSGGGG